MFATMRTRQEIQYLPNVVFLWFVAIVLGSVPVSDPRVLAGKWFFVWPTRVDNQPIYSQTKVGMFMIFFYHSFHFDPFSPPSFFSFSLVSTILCWSTWGSRENCKDYVHHETDISAKCVAKRIGLLWTVWVLDLQDQWTCWTVFPESYMVRMGHQHR